MERYASTCDGQQYVGIDLHRRRTVIVRTSAAGEVLEAVRIANDPEILAEVISRAGESGRWTPCKPSTPACIWRTRWGSKGLRTGG